MIKKLFIHMFNSAFLANEKNILFLFEPKKNARLLDLGCNDGSWSQKVADKIGTKNIYGIDNAKKQIEKAKKKGIKTTNRDLNSSFPYNNETFDVVHSNQVIEHLTETKNFVDEIYRVLKPKGYAVISSENLASWHNIFALLFGWQPFSLAMISGYRVGIGNSLSIHKRENLFSSLEHIRVFSYQAFVEIFRERGFIVEEILGAGYYPLPGFFAKLNPRHAAFLTIKIRKK